MTGTAILFGEEPETGFVAETADADTAAPGRPWVRVAAIVGIVALAVPFIAMIVVSLTTPWLPTGDVALFEVRTADVGGPFSPLLGVYSRFGWYHPGPVAYWVLALPYRLLGARPAGMLVGTALVHGAAVAGTVALAWRRGGRALALAVALLLLLVIHALGVDRLVYFWNPYLAIFAVAFLVMATWSVLDGDIQFVPVVIGVSCFAWQAHFGYLGVAGALAGLSVLGAVVVVVLDLRADGPARYRLRSLIILAAVTALTAVVCLAPVLVQQVSNQPGNVTLLLESLSANRDQVIGFEWAGSIVAGHLSPVGIWLTGTGTPSLALGVGGALKLALPFAALVAVAVLAGRAGQWSAVRFLFVTAASALAGLIAVSRTVGVPYPYLADWLRPVAALLWLSVGWGLWCVARSRGWLRGSVATRVTAGAAVALALVAVGTAVVSISGGALRLPDAEASAPVEVLAPGVVRAADGQALVRLRSGGGWCAGELTHGLAAQLVENGTDIVVDARLFPLEYGPERVRTDPAPVVELVCGPAAGERAAKSPVPPVAVTGLFSPAELARFRTVKSEIESRLRARGRADLAVAVENPLMAAAGTLATSGDAQDKALAAEFDDFMARAGRGAAVFYWPDGESRLPL